MLYLSNENDIKIDGLSALYFYSEYFHFHKKMQIMIEKIENKYKNIKFTAIDVNSFKNQCSRFDVKSVPTIIIYNNQVEIKRINGLILTSAFKAIFSDICM